MLTREEAELKDRVEKQRRVNIPMDWRQQGQVLRIIEKLLEEMHHLHEALLYDE